MSRDLRRAMVDNQIRSFDVTDQRVLAAFETVPRELFLPERLADLAYSDAVLTAVCDNGTKRPLIAPLILGRMFQALDLGPADNVLIVAAGTGYAAAIAAELCGSVTALESEAGFVHAIEANAEVLGLAGCKAVQGPLGGGVPARAPYAAILICGAIERDIQELLGQLAPGGRLVAIQTASHEATRRSGKVIRFDRIGADVSPRVVFDATAPVLEAFRLEPAFVF